MKKNESIKKAMIRKTAKEAKIISNRLSTCLDLPMNEDADILPLDEQLKESLRTLLYPGNISNISVTIRGEGAANTVLCVDEDSCVAAGFEKEDVFLKKMAIEDFIEKLIGFFENDAQLQFLETSLALSRNGLYALLSTVDRLRFNRMLAMLEHQKESLDLNVTDIKAMLIDTIENPDPRWLLANVLVMDKSDKDLDLDAGIEELKSLGVFEKGEALELTGKGILLTAGLGELEAFCGIKSFYYDSKELTTVTLLIFRTRSFLWTIELNENALYALNFETAALAIFGILNRGDYSDGPYFEEDLIDESEEAESIEVEALTRCENCGEKLKATDKFCLSCGAAVKPKKEEVDVPKDRICLSCGAKLKPGIKFCTSCGAPTSPKICPNCQANISPADKFCKKCGQAL